MEGLTKVQSNEKLAHKLTNKFKKLPLPKKLNKLDLPLEDYCKDLRMSKHNPPMKYYGETLRKSK